MFKEIIINSLPARLYFEANWYWLPTGGILRCFFSYYSEDSMLLFWLYVLNGYQAFLFLTSTKYTLSSLYPTLFLVTHRSQIIKIMIINNYSISKESLLRCQKGAHFQMLLQSYFLAFYDFFVVCKCQNIREKVNYGGWTIAKLCSTHFFLVFSTKTMLYCVVPDFQRSLVSCFHKDVLR